MPADLVTMVRRGKLMNRSKPPGVHFSGAMRQQLNPKEIKRYRETDVAPAAPKPKAPRHASWTVRCCGIYEFIDVSGMVLTAPVSALRWR